MSFRIALIGAGFFSQFHLEAWERVSGAELVAVVDRDLAKAQAAASKSKSAKAFADLGAMQAELSPNLWDIATPPVSHRDLVEQGAGLGLAMICQKPLAPTFQEAEAIVQIADHAQVPLIVHENFRFQPWYQEARRVIEGGDLGQVLSLSFRLRPGDGQGPDAYLARQPYFQTMPRFLVHETAVHFIDVFRFLLGEPKTVFASLRRLNPAIAGEDAGHLLFTFEGGCSALFDGNRLVDHVAENPRLTMGEMLLEGTKATLRLDGDGGLWLRAQGAKEQPHAYSWSNQGFGGDCVYALQQHVVDALSAKERPVNSARAYLRNFEIEEAVYRSAKEDRLLVL